MKTLTHVILWIMTISLAACDGGKETKDTGFRWQTDQFADARILRYQVPGFESLTLKQKELLYYLSQAAQIGRAHV